MKKIEDPNTIALLISSRGPFVLVLEQGNLVVRHPEGNHHLCLVKREAPTGVEKESSKKVGVEAALVIVVLLFWHGSVCLMFAN